MGNLAYIDELGIGAPEVDDTEVETNEPEEQSEVETDFVQEQEDTPATEETEGDTEPNSELLKSLKKQIEGMEKRLADKDSYIKELREASKQKEAEEQIVDTKEEDDEDFWDNPEGQVKKLKEMLKEQREVSRIQQLQIQETIYASTVENYWKTVNPDALKEAVATDTEFAEKFNNSREPYKTAYEYLTNKAKSKSDKELSPREQIKKEPLEEMGLSKGKKEAPPSINGGGKSSSTKPSVSDDGFASVFGSEY